MSDPNNYRPITILSWLNKLFTAVFNERLTNVLEENAMLNENQADFRKSYSTADHVFSLYALIEIIKFEKKKCFAHSSISLRHLNRFGGLDFGENYFVIKSMENF